MHLGRAECHVLLSGHCDVDLDRCPSFKDNHVQTISLVLFEIGILNLVCGCILEWWSVLYY